MNAFLNYLVESNVGLCAFLLVYILLLKKETEFVKKRLFLLVSIGVSLVFPLLHFETSENFIPSLANLVPPNWLPEVVVYADRNAGPSITRVHFDLWFAINAIYSTGVILSLVLFLLSIVRLIQKLTSAPGMRVGDFYIVESPENRSSFSFFNFIFVGQADKLSQHEKSLIIDHECVHARRLHSFDVLLINVIGIFFWFNPVIKIYKKIFVQLHEYEADARAVEDRDVNNYCSLLAKVALLSADFKLANHFSNSLTVKRIEMMRTLKANISKWKVLAVCLTLPCFFFIVSCQDQVVNDITDIAKNSNNALLAPAAVQQRFEEVKKANPSSTYILVELNDAAKKKLDEMEQSYGLPRSMEVFKPVNGEYTTGSSVVGKSDSGVVVKNLKGKDEDLHSYAIIEYNQMANKISENSADQDEIFTIVEKAAEYPGGMPELVKYLSSNIQYPQVARMKGIEGAVFVSFVVEKDGSVTNATVVKGLSAECDGEATRVVSSFPKWAPAEQNGKVVRSRFVIPIKYSLGSGNSAEQSGKGIKPLNDRFKVTYSISDEGGSKVIKGRILDSSNEPLRGANVLLKGTSSGTTTDANGEFNIKPPAGTNVFVVSFVGFDTEEHSF